jgi:hypothetical protein
MASLVLALVVLATGLPLGAAAQRDATPMWVDRISASHTPGRELADPLTMTIDLHVTSRSGPVSGADVSILIIGPANEQIPARGTTGRDGFARLDAQIPGGGPYQVIVRSLYFDTYFYDPNLDTHAFPGYFILPVGSVHVADGKANVTLDFRRIQQFTSEGVFVREWQPEKTIPDEQQYHLVNHLAVDSAGFVYAGLWGIAAPGAAKVCEIHKYTSYGVLVDVIGGACADGLGQLETIRGIAVDSQDRLYVVDGIGDQARVEIFDSDGNYLSSWAIPFPLGHDIGSLAIDLEDNLYMDNLSSNQIHKFDQFGMHQLSWNSPGSPADIAVDSHNVIYVTHWPPTVVDKFSSAGQHLGSVALEANWLAIDASDRLYAAVFEGAEIVKTDPFGSKLASWGSPGTGPGQFADIYDIAIHR